MPRKMLPRKQRSSDKSEPSPSFNFFSKDSIDILFKIPLALVSIFYISGIVVQGLYFGRFGINTLSLFRLSYILAGFWAVFVIIFPSCLLVIGVVILVKPAMFLSHLKTKYLSLRSTGLRISICLIILGFYLTIPKTVFPFLLRTNSDWVSISRIAVTFCVGAFTIFLLLKVVKMIKDPRPKILTISLFLLVFISAYVSVLDYFSKTLYQNIPYHLGGGKPVPVNLIIKANEKEILLLEQEMETSFLKNVDIAPDNKKIEDSGNYWVKVFLIFETDDGFYIKAQNSSVIFLRRDSVLHITYFDTIF